MACWALHDKCIEQFVRSYKCAFVWFFNLSNFASIGYRKSDRCLIGLNLCCLGRTVCSQISWELFYFTAMIETFCIFLIPIPARRNTEKWHNSVVCKFSNHEFFVDKIQRYFQTSLQTSVVSAIEDCTANRNKSWTNIFFLPAESFQSIWFASQLCCLASFVFVARSLIGKDAMYSAAKGRFKKRDENQINC